MNLGGRHLDDLPVTVLLFNGLQWLGFEAVSNGAHSMQEVADDAVYLHMTFPIGHCLSRWFGINS